MKLERFNISPFLGEGSLSTRPHIVETHAVSCQRYVEHIQTKFESLDMYCICNILPILEISGVSAHSITNEPPLGICKTGMYHWRIRALSGWAWFSCQSANILRKSSCRRCPRLEWKLWQLHKISNHNKAPQEQHIASPPMILLKDVPSQAKKKKRDSK